MLGYTPVHFTWQEFLPRQVWERLVAAGETWKAPLLMDERIVRHADRCREKFGVLYINTWSTGGDRNESGLRLPGMATFKPDSQHSFGRADDAISPTLSGEDMRRYILDHPAEFPEVTAMETGVSWLHSDVRNCPRITLVNP